MHVCVHMNVTHPMIPTSPLTGDYHPDDFDRKKHPDCPTTTSHRSSVTGKITWADNKRAKQTIACWKQRATRLGRKDRTDAEWQARRDNTENRHLDHIKVVIEKLEHAVTPDGRCEKALETLLKRRSTWTAFGKKTNFNWTWYVRRFLPRYYRRLITWKLAASPFNLTAGLWSSRGSKKPLKSKVFDPHNEFSAFSFCIRASKTINTVMDKLL